MMKHEFENLIDAEIGADDYKKIEIVYVNYPGIETKKQIADIYKIGMTAIEDMLPRATEIMNVESDIANKRKRLYELGIK